MSFGSLLGLLPTLLAILALLSPDVAIAETSVIFTQPFCGQYAYKDPVELNDGGLLTHTRGNFFCTRKDFPPDFDALSGKIGAAIAQRLENSLTDPIIGIRIADYIFSDVNVAKYVCSQFRISPFNVTIYTQQSDVSSAPVGLRPQAAAILQDCLGTSLQVVQLGCDVINVRGCPSNQINTMHLKLIEVRRTSGRTAQIASSGNIGKGIFANLEDWVFFDDNMSSDIHKCVWPILEGMRRNDRPRLAEIYVNCKITAPFDEKNEFLLMPFDAEAYYSTFYKMATNALEIDIVSMDFHDSRLKGALYVALKNKSHLNFIVSSDWYYAFIRNTKLGNADADEIAMAMDLAKKFPSQVEIYFVETNFYSDFGNTVHHKFAVFRTANGTSVLAGTTNMNNGAIRFNLDQAYIFHSRIADQYGDYVRLLLGRAYRAPEMPTKLPEIELGTLQ